MTKHSKIAPRVSLIERAAAAYDFASAVRAPEPFVPADAVYEAPAPTPATHVDPAWKAVPFGGREAKVAIAELAERGFIMPDAQPSALAEEFRIVKREILLDGREREVQEAHGGLPSRGGRKGEGWTRGPRCRGRRIHPSGYRRSARGRLTRPCGSPCGRRRTWRSRS